MASVLVILMLIVKLTVYAISINNGTESMQSRIEKLEASLNVLETTVANISATLIEHTVQNKPVLFFAIIYNKNFHLETESTVVFETVIINEGGHYNKNDGIFVAPREGIYFFSWTVSTYGAYWVITELVVENIVISSTGEREVDANTYSSASMTALCRVKKDEHAFIRTTGYSHPHYFHSTDNQPRTSFIGMLIHSA